MEASLLILGGIIGIYYNFLIAYVVNKYKESPFPVLFYTTIATIICIIIQSMWHNDFTSSLMIGSAVIPIAVLGFIVWASYEVRKSKGYYKSRSIDFYALFLDFCQDSTGLLIF